MATAPDHPKASEQTSPDSSATVKRLLIYLLPRLATENSAPEWPPDVFGLCMSVLQQTGAYCAVLKNWPPSGGTATEWAEKIEEIGWSWLSDWPTIRVPKEVWELWSVVVAGWDIRLTELCGKTEVSQALLQLCAIADEACVGMGTPGPHYDDQDKQFDKEAVQKIEELFSHVDSMLRPGDFGSSLCKEIDPSCLRVLPKMRTPQTGLTIRSLSHHLSLCSATEVSPKWVLVSYPHQELALNLLLVPWPRYVAPVQFRPTQALNEEMRNMSEDDFGFFTFSHLDNTNNVVRTVQQLLLNSEKMLGPMHGVVLPELALSPAQHGELRGAVLAHDAFLISGIGSSAESGKRHGRNLISVDFPRYDESFQQAKHHRWKLDENQLKQYGLGSLLYPERVWWEHIDVQQRELMFISVLPWLVFSVLICEDLARPDPIGDLVRAVGPNLVVALLMDGPQLKQRWGARYATVLADDPGCSVLTLTSVGMSTLSRPTDASVSRSRVVALWKDAENGPIEIELPDGYDGVILSLAVRYTEEWAADGRSDHKNAGYPLLAGIHHVPSASK